MLDEEIKKDDDEEVELTAEEMKAEIQRLKTEAEQAKSEAEKAFRSASDKDKALKEERTKSKGLKESLQSTVPADLEQLTAKVKEQIQKETYNKSVDDYVGQVQGLTDEEKKAWKEQIALIPPTFDAKLDADFALDRLRRISRKDGNNPTNLTPISQGTGAGGFTPNFDADMSKFTPGARKLGAELAGLTEDDYKKFGKPLKITR